MYIKSVAEPFFNSLTKEWALYVPNNLGEKFRWYSSYISVYLYINYKKGC